MLKKYLPHIPFMKNLTINEKWFLTTAILTLHGGDVMYISTRKFAGWGGVHEDTVKQWRLVLEKKGFLVVIEIKSNGKKIYKISTEKLAESVDGTVNTGDDLPPVSSNTGGDLPPHWGQKTTSTGGKRPPLNINNKYINNNIGNNKKSEEEPIVSSPSFTPVENVRIGSLCDPALVRTEEQKATAIYWLEQMRSKKNNG